MRAQEPGDAGLAGFVAFFRLGEERRRLEAGTFRAGSPPSIAAKSSWSPAPYNVPAVLPVSGGELVIDGILGHAANLVHFLWMRRRDFS